MADINFGILDTQLPGRIAAIPQEAQKQQTANMLQAMQMQGAMRQNEMSQMQLDELKSDRAEMIKLQQELEAKGGSPDLGRLANVLMKSPKHFKLGIELSQKLSDQARFDKLNFGDAPPPTPTEAPANMLPGVVSPPAGITNPPAAPQAQTTIANLNRQIAANMALGTEQGYKYAGMLQKRADALGKRYTVGTTLMGSEGEIIGTAPAAPSPIARMQAELNALPPNDPRRPALEAQINSALITQQQGADRLKQGQGQLNVAQRNAATNEARVALQKLGLVDPEGIELVATAVGEGRLPVDRLNGGTALLFAKLLKATPDLDFTKLSVAQAENKASAVSNARIASRQTLTDVDATQAENIVRGNLPPATGPNAGKIMNEVLRLNPDYNSRDFGLQTAAEKEFNAGKNGNKTRSLNVAVSHLTTLDTAAAALRANDVRAFNQFKQAWQRETGKSAPTDFNAVRELVADEIVAAVVPGVGALADRRALKDTILAKSSPEQLQGAVKYYKELLGGQLGGLEKQYNASTRKTDFRQRYLTPEAIAALTPGQNAPPAAARNIPQAAINDLKAGRGTPEEFDEHFGAGAAARVQGTK